MENTIEKLEQQLTEIKVVKNNLNVSEAEIKAQLKSLKEAVVEADKCRPAYYPVIKGWTILDGKFEGFKLTGTVLENKNGTKKLLKGHMDGKFVHVDLAKFSGRIADSKGIVQRTYRDGQLVKIPV